MTLRRASLALSTLLLLGAVAACGPAPEKKPAAAPSSSAPSPSTVKLTDPEMFALAKKALLPEDALAGVTSLVKSEPESTKLYQSMLLECTPGLSTDLMITGRAFRYWPTAQRQWALSGAFGFQEATAAQVIGEIRKTVPEKCRAWRSTTPDVNRTVDYTSDVVLPELPGTTASYGYCITVTFDGTGTRRSGCVIFVGRAVPGMDIVASFHFAIDNEAVAKATVAQIAPKVAEQLLKV